MLHSRFRSATAALALMIGAVAMISTATAGERPMIKPNFVKAPSEASNQTRTTFPAAGTALVQGSTDIVSVSNKPDLLITDYVFLPGNNLRVTLRNAGNGGAPSVLRLTVCSINGTPAYSQTGFLKFDRHVKGIRPKSEVDVWFATDRKLPSGVALTDTVFRIDADANGTVAELYEHNNTATHNYGGQQPTC